MHKVTCLNFGRASVISLCKCAIGGEGRFGCMAWQRTGSCSLDHIKFGNLCTGARRIFNADCGMLSWKLPGVLSSCSTNKQSEFKF